MPLALKISGITVRRYAMALSLEGPDEGRPGLTGVQVTGNRFEDIGSSSPPPATAALRLINAQQNRIAGNTFLRVNNTRPLPRGLITELLPEVSTNLPPRLAAKKIPSAVCDWLNQHAESPFHGLIRRASSAESPAQVVTDTGVVKMIADSLHSPSGCLFPYRNIATGETDLDGICAVLVAYWKAVRNVSSSGPAAEALSVPKALVRCFAPTAETKSGLRRALFRISVCVPPSDSHSRAIVAPSCGKATRNMASGLDASAVETSGS